MQIYLNVRTIFGLLFFSKLENNKPHSNTHRKKSIVLFFLRTLQIKHRFSKLRYVTVFSDKKKTISSSRKYYLLVNDSKNDSSVTLGRFEEKEFGKEIAYEHGIVNE